MRRVRVGAVRVDGMHGNQVKPEDVEAIFQVHLDQGLEESRLALAFLNSEGGKAGVEFADAGRGAEKMRGAARAGSGEPAYHGDVVAGNNSRLDGDERVVLFHGL